MNDRKLRACITVDTEQDCPPFMSTFRGIEEGLDPLLQLLDDEHVAATFFTTGDVAVKYPNAVERIVTLGHELGCHGHTHRSFLSMDHATAETEIQASSDALRRFTSVLSFRAPYFAFPDRYLSLLENHGFLADWSQAKYKLAYYRRPARTSLTRIPASATSSMLRLPGWMRNRWLNALSSPLVLFVHPWEFVDLRSEPIRWDCRFNTGAVALQRFRSAIRFLKRKNAVFLRAGELAGL